LHSILMTNVVRNYLVRKFPSIRASATTREVVSALRSESLIPADRTLTLFERVDLLKFAQDRIQQADAKSVGAESRAVVHEIVAREEAVVAAAALEAERNNATAGTDGKGPGQSGKKPKGRQTA
jgi:hypothetical protein